MLRSSIPYAPADAHDVFEAVAATLDAHVLDSDYALRRLPRLLLPLASYRDGFGAAMREWVLDEVTRTHGYRVAIPVERAWARWELPPDRRQTPPVRRGR